MLSTLAIILLLPYFAWGIYALRLRYRYHDELSLVVEGATLLGLLGFYVVEFVLLREALQHSRLQLMMAVLGLVTSGAALYGHMAISFLSRLIVDAVVPGQDARDDRPRLGPAEALEKHEDFDGALNEYYVIARMFPKDEVVHLRIAALLIRLARAEEAVPWLQRAEKCATTEARALTVTNRQVELFERHLQRPEVAREVLGGFLARYPNAQEAPALRARLASIGVAPRSAAGATLSALADTPLTDEAEATTGSPKRGRKSISPKRSSDAGSVTTRSAEELPAVLGGLTALEDAPVMAEPEPTVQVPDRTASTASASFSLEKLDEAAPLPLPEEPEADRPKSPGIGLEPLDPA